MAARSDRLFACWARELDSEWRITELEPGRHVVYEATAPAGGSLAMKQTVAPRDGGSRVQLEIDYELPGGFVGDVLEHIVEGQNEREAERSLQNLKELLDG
ncbi:MAG: SRPBCC family protein [Gemmatimonadales bacterium]|nr:SRPBCC family protein [Gemmatimonadales bacterium]MBA3689670.1 SRPBCC family protein [Chloroflexota bacterium]